MLNLSLLIPEKQADFAAVRQLLEVVQVLIERICKVSIAKSVGPLNVKFLDYRRDRKE